MTSTCLKCGSTSFELKLASLKNSAFTVNFVQCSSCGGVVGVTELNNVNAVQSQQNRALQRIAKALNVSVEFDSL